MLIPFQDQETSVIGHAINTVIEHAVNVEINTVIEHAINVEISTIIVGHAIQ